jgi:hypothetical protein
MTAASFPSGDSQEDPSTSNRPLGRTSGLWMMVTFTVSVAFAVAVALAVTAGSVAGRSSLAIQPLTKHEGTSSSPVAAHQSSSRLAQDATCPLRDVGARCRRSSGWLQLCGSGLEAVLRGATCEYPHSSTSNPSIKSESNLLHYGDCLQSDSNHPRYGDCLESRRDASLSSEF